MSLAQAPTIEPSTRVGLTPSEWVVYVVEPILLLAAALWSQLTQTDNFQLMWADSLGQKMLLDAGLLAIANAALLIVGEKLVKRWLEPQPAARYTLLGLLHAGCALFLFLPAVWVLILGPATVQIMRTLAL